jgi:hypothetical protein
MRTIRFSRVRRDGGSHFLITDDGLIWHSRRFPDSDRRANVQVRHEKWLWTEIDRFEFVPVPKTMMLDAYYRRSFWLLGRRLVHWPRLGLVHWLRPRQRLRLCAWPTAEIRSTPSTELQPWPYEQQDYRRRETLRV